MMMEWIEGLTIRSALDLFLKGREKEKVEGKRMEELGGLMSRMGTAVGRLHQIGVVHGDLTTSNLMLRPPKEKGQAVEESGMDQESGKSSLEGDVVIIDFGLAGQNIQEEDKAVDLYVLERAFGSTHPTIEDAFQDALAAYGKSYKGGNIVLKRLADVRMRGRKRSMLG